MIKNNDKNWIEDEDTIRYLFQDHFRNLFTTNINTTDQFQTDQHFPAFGICVSRTLQSEVQDSEIKQALFDMAA